MIASRQSQAMTGAVMVIGGGIAGIQSALDLADSGFKVYLVEATPAIGGNMARLDKTFPTNDCSMCILSPKIVECGRHLNIKTITWSHLEEISGQAGNFNVKIRRRARFVDLNKCTGCGECVTVCPVAVANEFDAALGERKAIFRPYPQAYPSAFVIDKQGFAACRQACPAGVNVQGFIVLIAQGKFDEALELYRARNPFPATCGRICNQPCQETCNRGAVDEALAIRALHRFLADREIGAALNSQPPKMSQEILDIRKAEFPQRGANRRVAIVGSGPAGLTCAWALANMGYKPVVFEALAVAGGMLRVGVPQYRLPVKILDYEIETIKCSGVEIRLKTPIGTRLTFNDLFNQHFEAIFIATGTHKSRQLDMEGENLIGVMHGAGFLYQTKTDLLLEVANKVVAVIGGGNVAIDSARTALRLGAHKVTIVYRRSRVEMPSSQEEITACEEEGIAFCFLTAPIRILGKDGKVAALECVRMVLGAPDASGRRRPIPVPDSKFVIEADMVIPAISQEADREVLRAANDLLETSGGLIAVDARSLATNIKGVFAGGDVVSGPDLAVNAIAAGQRSAVAIDKFLNDKQTSQVRHPLEFSRPPRDLAPSPPGAYPWTPRVPMRHLPVNERIRSFAEVELGYTAEQAIQEAQRCLHCTVCSECLQCVRVCKAGAVCHDQQDNIEQIHVGAIIAAPGFEPFVPDHDYGQGYTTNPDVVTSMEFERILSASGPFGGHVVRPSDGRAPRRIAFLQCIGSRDVSCRNGYCSSVCCMYAVKEAIIAKEHQSFVEPTIFVMDIRAYGKDFDKFVERSKSEYGIVFKYSRVADVVRDEKTGENEVVYADESGRLQRERFDLVVLSVGLEPSADMRALARTLGVNMNAFGFIWTEPLRPLATSRAGLFAAGVATGPKDIPETVIQASAAACEAARLLAPARNTLVTAKTYPPERNIAGEPVRVGVFICHCGINIAGVVDVLAVKDYAATLPGVAYADHNLYTCSQDTQKLIKQRIEEHRLNRVVVASCSPRTHEVLFQETMRESGLNPHLFVMANIRDQCSWVHQRDPQGATEKAQDLVRMAVAMARLAAPLKSVSLPVTPTALVIGGGLSGMTVALAIADQGFKVCLVEKGKELGGNLRKLQKTLDGQDLQALLYATISQVQNHPRVQTHVGATVRDIKGFVGNYESALSDGAVFKHGAIVVATGALEYQPKEYGYGQHKKIMTQLEFSRRLEQGLKNEPSSVVMIQCVGSREEPRLYCSRTCCSQAIQNAIRLKALYPRADVHVLYRDMRTYGLREPYYAQARDQGVLFTRFDLSARPEVTWNGKNGAPTVSVKDPILGQTMTLKPDLLVLSTGMIADIEANDALAKQLKVPLNQDGFFLEAHVKLRPVEFATDGIYVAGLAHAPKSADESTAQALAAASRACVLLSRRELEAYGTIGDVDVERCAACGLCEQICAFGAITLEIQRIGQSDRLLAKINPALCKGCGACSASCRCGAITLRGFTDEQIMAEISAL